MNFINKVVCITAFFALGSISAKPMAGRAGAPAGNQTPARVTPAAKTPGRVTPAVPAAAQTYKQLHDNILKRTANTVFTGNQFQQKFVTDTVAQAKAADIGADGLKFLLQTARDKFAPFTGDNDRDLALLLQINEQIENAVSTI